MIKRKTASIVVLISGVLLFAGSAQAANVLTNASFESPDVSGFGNLQCDPSFSCTDWFGFESAFISSSTFDDGQNAPPARTGTQVAKMFGPFGSGPTSGIFQGASANPGELWQASAYIQNWDDPLGDTGGDPMEGDNLGQLQLIFLNSSGDAIGVTTQEFDAGQPRNVWTLLSVSAVAPALTTDVRILLAHQQETGFDGGSVWWDDASLQIVPVPAAVWLFGSALGLLGVVRRRIAK